MRTMTGASRRWRVTRGLLPAALGGLLLAFSAIARAEVYRMDLIVFVDRGPASEAPLATTLPNLGGAVALDDPAALQAVGLNLLPEAQFALQNEWQRLRNSRRFQPLARLAWTQRDPPGERGPSLRLRVAGGEQPLLDGSIALLIVGRYLTLDTDLVYTTGTDNWHFVQRRKMRRDELHHVDGGKLGIVARVSKLDGGSGGAL